MLCDFPTPLEKLMLMSTLDTGIPQIRQMSSPQLHEAFERRRRTISRIDTMLFGMRASAAASTNWPSVFFVWICRCRICNVETRMRMANGAIAWDYLCGKRLMRLMVVVVVKDLN